MSRPPLIPRIFYAIGDMLRWIPENMFQPRIFPVVFISAFVAIGIYFRYHEILFKTPQGVHKWRQTDCASQAFRYSEEDAKFLEPRLMNLEYNKDGRTCSDFPMIYYSVGKMWKWFGHAEWIYRGLVLLIFFIASFLLYRMAESILRDSWLGLVIGLFMMSSPVIAFYACNYLMNVPALSFAVMSLYFFYQHHRSGRWIHLLLFGGFALAGGLFKVSSLGPFMVLAGLWLLERLGWLKMPQALFPKGWKTLWVFILALLGVTSWLAYAEWYNANNIQGVFLIGTRPVWIVKREDFPMMFDHIWNNVNWSYFRASTQFILLGIFLSVLFFGKRGSSWVRSLMGWMAAVFLVFLVFFFEVIWQHDYYVIDFFLLAPLILLAFSEMIQKRWPWIYRFAPIHILLLVFLIHNLTFARLRMNDQYADGTWQNRDYYEKYKALEELRPSLDSLGIKKEDRISCMPDMGFNVALYYTQRKGFNDFWWPMDDSISIGYPQAYGAKYLFLLDTAAASKPVIRKNFDAPFYRYKNVWIYRMSDIRSASLPRP